MTLSSRLADDFTSSTRRKGENYFAQGRVRIAKGSESKVEAMVRGTALYAVDFELEESRLAASCECPYFESEGPCKHLWATLRAAEARGYLGAAAAVDDLFLEISDFTAGFDDVPQPDLRLRAPNRPFVVSPPKMPAWEKQLADLQSRNRGERHEVWPAKRQILYFIDLDNSLTSSALVLWLAWRTRKADGEWGVLNALSLGRRAIQDLPDAADRHILSSLTGAPQHYGYGASYADYHRAQPSWQVPPAMAQELIPAIIRTGRCRLRGKPFENLPPLELDEAGRWRFALEMRRGPQSGWEVAGVLRRGEERMELATPLLVTEGFAFTPERVAPLELDSPFQWIAWFRGTGVLRAPLEDAERLLAALLASPGAPAIEPPEELHYEEVSLTPRPVLRLRGAPAAYNAGKLRAELSFLYGETSVAEADPAAGLYDQPGRRFLRRDRAAERTAVERLDDLGARLPTTPYGPRERELPAAKLPALLRALVEEGWLIEADGKAFRRSASFRLEVSSGVDWFELHGEADYGDATARLPELLEALRRGDGMVALDDGTFGLVPEEWLRRFGMLAGMGAVSGDHVRFRRHQAGLLDALLAAQPEASCDETFARVREELRSFKGVQTVEQPEGFVGHLRDYQREGLGWIHFLRRFSFGGCLADDMGVGKTAQVLALFETRRQLRAEGESIAPSLVVMPRSLVFNWMEESARFTPRLRVLDYTGLAREEAAFADYDMILSTYGTLRRDVVHLKDFEFDYVVLDEAQAIKNASSESAKAARLLRGRHRLALSGTPVENHLGELWSLFEFLNPGMLGAGKIFKLTGASARKPDEDTRRLLAHALRPFILRRTKEQVARELPAKTEQTLYCELQPPQRKLYNELRAHYRKALLGAVDRQGLAKSKIMVLEALLRLRQAACHPGLIDPKRADDPSAKLEVLLEHLREVLAEGHKALVFSQFTSFLALVRESLDAENIVYEYLDGQTTDRQARVTRFQNDPKCPLFLISLKAGGLGLNLTAADYVFLLDPWWNPAVEAQAIDRAHRIGQTRQVFAYRIIARDTVEEKVLELQKTKRDLANAIVGADNSLIRDLRREDLELLLG